MRTQVKVRPLLFSSRRAKPRDIEGPIQSAFMQWFDLQYPRLLAYAIPNGGKRNKIVAAKLKRQGVKAGIPDVFIASPAPYYNLRLLRTSLYCGLYIEFKTDDAPSSIKPKQRERIAQLREAGYAVEVCSSDNEARIITQHYLGGKYVPRAIKEVRCVGRVQAND